MNRRTGNRRHRPRAGAPAAATLALAATLLAGCGHQFAGGRQAAAAAAAAASALSGNSACLQAAPAASTALGVLRRLHSGALGSAAAGHQLAAAGALFTRLTRATSDDVLQENLAQTADAFTAFRAVLADRSAAAYPATYTDLAGKLAGFRRICLVGNAGSGTGAAGWGPATGSTVLSHSATACQGRWSLRVANRGPAAATAGFTDSQALVATTLMGSEETGLWARAVSGTPVLTLEVRELAGGTIVGSGRVTMRLGDTCRFVHLAYRVRRPGVSSLRMTVSAAALAPGDAFLVDGITMVRA